MTPLPTFGHVPMVLGSDRTRLSKRHGAMSVLAYKELTRRPDCFGTRQLTFLALPSWDQRSIAANFTSPRTRRAEWVTAFTSIPVSYGVR